MFCGKVCSDKLEKIQERALRFVYNDHDSNYSQLCEKANIKSLLHSRICVLVKEICKCVHGINPPIVNDIFIAKSITYNLRNDHVLQIPRFKTVTFGKKTVKYLGAKIWNQLLMT